MPRSSQFDLPKQGTAMVDLECQLLLAACVIYKMGWHDWDKQHIVWPFMCKHCYKIRAGAGLWGGPIMDDIVCITGCTQ